MSDIFAPITRLPWHARGIGTVGAHLSTFRTAVAWSKSWRTGIHRHCRAAHHWFGLNGRDSLAKRDLVAMPRPRFVRDLSERIAIETGIRLTMRRVALRNRD